MHSSINVYIATILILLLAVSHTAISKDDISIPSMPTEFEPNSLQPYGALNPNAPDETKQFSFMIGEFDCQDKSTRPDGSWVESKVIWNSSYFLNGSGIQDKFWSETVVATGTRIFDSAKKKWVVNYFQTSPAYYSGVWEGLIEGSDMVMRASRGEGESRLTFHNINNDSFDWRGESIDKDGNASAFWIINCQRKS